MRTLVFAGLCTERDRGENSAGTHTLRNKRDSGEQKAAGKRGVYPLDLLRPITGRSEKEKGSAEPRRHTIWSECDGTDIISH